MPRRRLAWKVMTQINYPKRKTYFICRNDDDFKVTLFGSVDTNQCVITDQPIMDKYTNESRWVDELIKSGKSADEISVFI